MKKVMIIVPVVIAAIIFIFILLFFSPAKVIDNNIKHYLKSGTYMDADASEIMPALESLPEYESVYYQYYCYKDYTSSMLLIVDYDKQTYEAEKAKLDETYTFLDHAVKYNDKGDFIIPEYNFAIAGYNFRVIECKGDVEAYYPHSFGMTATSDEKNSIAHLYFYDQSLDLISDSSYPKSMAEFVEVNFPYKW